MHHSFIVVDFGRVGEGGGGWGAQECECGGGVGVIHMGHMRNVYYISCSHTSHPAGSFFFTQISGRDF